MGARSLDFVRPRPSAANLLSDPFSNAFDTYLSQALSISCRHPGRAGPPRRPRAEGDGDRGGRPVTGPKVSVSFRFGGRMIRSGLVTRDGGEIANVLIPPFQCLPEVLID